MSALRRDPHGADTRRGFSLLEVMVALSILALALVAIAGIDANAFEASNYGRSVTVATLLARSKMLDVEEQIRKDGLTDSDKEYDGDFSKEGFPSYTWAAVVRPVEVDLGQLLGGLFGGDVSTEQLPEKIQGFLGAMRGEGKKELTSQVAGSDLTKILGGGGIEVMLKQVGDTLKKSIREITLEITWKDGSGYTESIRFVQYVTTSGRLSVPNSAQVQVQPGQVGQGILPGQAGQLGGPGGLGGLGGLPGNPNAAGFPGLGGAGVNNPYGVPTAPGHRGVGTTGSPSLPGGGMIK
jgi:general secretion pathway protein I